jgi:hypothetical protein
MYPNLASPLELSVCFLLVEGERSIINQHQTMNLGSSVRSSLIFHGYGYGCRGRGRGAR